MPPAYVALPDAVRPSVSFALSLSSVELVLLAEISIFAPTLLSSPAVRAPVILSTLPAPSSRFFPAAPSLPLTKGTPDKLNSPLLPAKIPPASTVAVLPVMIPPVTTALAVSASSSSR